MTYKNIQTMHEVRLMIAQVGIPLVIGGIVLATNKEVQNGVKNVVNKIKDKFNKKEKEEPTIIDVEVVEKE